METLIAKQMFTRFPNLNITEDVISDENYWVNIQIGNLWLVIQKTLNQGIGLSIVNDQSLDFSGHDHVVSEVGEAFDWAVCRIAELSAENERIKRVRPL